MEVVLKLCKVFKHFEQDYDLFCHGLDVPIQLLIKQTGVYHISAVRQYKFFGYDDKSDFSRNIQENSSFWKVLWKV